MQETWARSLGWEDPLEKEMAAHSSILAWKILWTEVGYNPCGSKSQTQLSNQSTTTTVGAWRSQITGIST